MSNLALTELTPRMMEYLKSVGHKKHVDAQAKDLCDFIVKHLDWKGLTAKSIVISSLNHISLSDLYPENVAVLNNNGFGVFKFQIMHKKEASNAIYRYIIIWDTINVENEIIKSYPVSEWTLLDCKKL